MKPHFRKASILDLNSLLHFAKATFITAYAHLNEPNDFQAYMDTAFHPDNFKKEMENPDSHFWLLEENNELIGYLKLNFGEVQTDLKEDDGMEIERIYVLNKLHGKGLGKLLINKAIEIAKEANMKYIWLGVWDINHKAIKFYEREGFEKFGTHVFPIGAEDQTDFLMRRFL